MPFTAIHGICLGQCVFKLPDAAGQDANLVVKHLSIRKDETVAPCPTCQRQIFRDKGLKKAHRFPLPVVRDPELRGVSVAEGYAIARDANLWGRSLHSPF